MSIAPKKRKEWVKEIEIVLEAARQVIAESESETDGQIQLNERLFVAAPVLAMKQRHIDFKRETKVVPFVFTSISEMLEAHPELKSKPNRVFVHAYLDTHIYLNLLKRSKCEDILDDLEGKQIIESRGANIG